MHLVVIARARCNEAGRGDVGKCEGPSRFGDLFHFQIWRRNRKLRRQKRRRMRIIVMTDGRTDRVRIPSRKKREGGDNFPEGVPGDGYFNDVLNLKIAQLDEWHY